MRIVLVDDIDKARFAVRELISSHYPQASIVAEAHNVQSAIEAIKKEKPDLVLLDIRMPDGTGFDLIKQLMPVNFKLIFITAFEEYAVQAFKFSALDFLTKPVIPTELVNALQKAQQQMAVDELNIKLNNFISNMAEITRESKKIVIKAKDSLRIINVSDIIRCEADSNYTRFHLKDGKNILASETLKEYESILTESGFFRSHHAHLVNLSHVQSFEKRDGGILIMSDKSIVQVAVRKKDTLLEILQKI